MKRRRLGALLFWAAAANWAAAQPAPARRPAVIVINKGYRLLLDAEKGGIDSFRSTYGVDRELLRPGHGRLPLFKIEFFTEGSGFTSIDSLQARQVRVSKSGEAVTLDFKDIGKLPVDARVTVRCPSNESLTYWSLEVNNRTTMWIGHIQFPVIEVPFDSTSEKNFNRILSSWTDGTLEGPVTPSMPIAGVDTPEIWRYNNYPGWVSAQLMAYYNELGGLYAACDDPAGLPKFIAPIMGRDGVTMGLGHYPGTRGPGITKLPYNVVLGTFHGDWYRAAGIYREWASQQPFCRTRLQQRTDVPKWIDSAVGIAFPMRGQGDWDPPAKVNPEYTPAASALPYLDKIAAGLKTPLMPIVFNWERGGPWVQPDSYPPAGGEAGMREFMRKAKANGWHPVLYGSGLCWVTWQGNTHYDGMPYFRSHGGEETVIRKADGSFYEDVWPWRKSYVDCVGTAGARRTVLEMTRQMASYGADVIQQFDQTPGPRPCYTSSHGHPPVPGPWMTEAFRSLLKADAAAGRSINPNVAFSCEGAPGETYLQDFQIWDARIKTCPLYSFLYHEYINGHQGLYTNRVNDEALRASTARALVMGYMVNFTLRDKGMIGYDWNQPWSSAIPDQKAILDWAGRTTRFRAGVARDYLVYGRMLRPWAVSGVTQRDFGWGKEPLVESGTWQAQDGRIGVVLANYANLAENPRVELEGSGTHRVTLYREDRKTEKEMELPAVLDLEMQPRSLALIEVK